MEETINFNLGTSESQLISRGWHAWIITDVDESNVSTFQWPLSAQFSIVFSSKEFILSLYKVSLLSYKILIIR